MEENNGRKRICAECSYWEPGEFWGGGGSTNHGVVIESKGWCLGKRNKQGEVVKRKRWNYCVACPLFDKKPMNGFMYQGGGGNTIEEDLENITSLMKELAEDSK